MKTKRAKGVYIDKRSGKICSQIDIDGKSTWLGTFETEKEAESAYAKARKKNPLKTLDDRRIKENIGSASRSKVLPAPTIICSLIVLLPSIC